jgi:hypothetical protein
MLQAAKLEAPRGYLGASSIGSECLRRIQWDWRKPKDIKKAQTLRIFWRGHQFESYVAAQFVKGGFDLRRGDPECGFVQAEGRFRGHCDGIFKSGPKIDSFGWPRLWEHKALGKTSWSAIEKHGLKKAKPEYYAQVQLYQAYLSLSDNPAIFTACNVETGELLHLLVPFDPAAAQEASDRAVTVLKADQAGETMPRISDDPTFWLCRFCPHKEDCHK